MKYLLDTNTVSCYLRGIALGSTRVSSDTAFRRVRGLVVKDWSKP